VPLGEVGYASALSTLLLVLAIGMALVLNLTGNERKEKKGARA
jgi:raffinose/stachyose/melibiose transport system permease protein